MVFQGSLKGVPMKCQLCIMQVSYIESFKDVSRQFQKSFTGVVREFLGSFE